MELSKQPRLSGKIATEQHIMRSLHHARVEVKIMSDGTVPDTKSDEEGDGQAQLFPGPKQQIG